MSYEPIQQVREIHNMPHLDTNLGEVSNKFGITYDSYWNSYTHSLIPMPTIIGGVGILAILCVQISLIGRCCFRCLKCGPNLEETTTHPHRTAQRKNAFNIQIKNLKIFFYVFAFCVVFADQILFFGNNWLGKGVSTGNDALDYLSSVFTQLTDDGYNLQSGGYELQYDIGNATEANCPQASQLEPYFDEYFNYINEYLDYVSPVNNDISNAQDGFNQYASTYKNQSIWVLYVVMMLGIVLYFIGVCLKSKCQLQISIAVSEIIMLIIFTFCIVELVIMMGLADFCIQPSQNIIQVVQPGQIYNLTEYYVSCEGTNPIDPYISDAEILINRTEYYVNLLLDGPCPGNTYLESALNETAYLQQNFDDIVALSDCPPTQNQLLDVLNNGLCTQAFRGFYLVWISQTLSAWCLLLCTIAVSIIYQYFGRFWGPEADVDDSILLDGGHHNSLQEPVLAHAEVYSPPSPMVQSPFERDDPAEEDQQSDDNSSKKSAQMHSYRRNYSNPAGEP